jgi:hypothetical protein
MADMPQVKRNSKETRMTLTLPAPQVLDHVIDSSRSGTADSMAGMRASFDPSATHESMSDVLDSPGGSGTLNDWKFFGSGMQRSKKPFRHSSGSHLHSAGFITAKTSIRNDSLWGTTSEVPPGEDPAGLTMEAMHQRAVEIIMQKQKDEAAVLLAAENDDSSVVSPEDPSVVSMDTSRSEDTILSSLAQSAGEFRRIDPSKSKKQLLMLGEFVVGHTKRKLVDNWHHIESKYASSSLVDESSNNVDTKLSNRGLLASDLIAVMCSENVKMNHKEIAKIFKDLGFHSKQLLHSRQIAALKVSLGILHGFRSKQKQKCEVDLQILQRDEEKVVYYSQLDRKFLPDAVEEPELRKKFRQAVEKNKLQMIKDMMGLKEKQEQLRIRAEQRMAKAKSDFERIFVDIQFSKGELSIGRHAMVRDTLNYCDVMIAEGKAEKDMLIPDTVVKLIGSDVFPKYISVGSARAAAAQQRVSSLKVKGTASVLPTKFGYTGYFRIKLHEPSSCVERLRLVVSYGRGLNGVTFRDLIEALQAYASTRIQSFIRAYQKRWRYYMARKIWRRIFHMAKVSMFGGWKNLTKYNWAIRRQCFRKIKSWQFYTRKARLRREHFRLTFWPFYVLRRHACEEATMREKTKFLVSRVLPTYIMLRNFRALKKYVQHQLQRNSVADAFHREKILKMAKSYLQFMIEWTQRNKILRKSWLKDGLKKAKKAVHLCKNTPFLIWRSYLHYKKKTRTISNHVARNARRSFFSRTPYRKRRTPTEIRAAMKEYIEAHRVENNIETVAGLSNEERERRVKQQEIEQKLALLYETPWPYPLKNQKKDIDYDEEDERENIPSFVSKFYKKYCERLKKPADLDFLKWADEFTRKKVNVLRQKFECALKWDLLEVSARYCRLAHTAFKNLHDYAVIRTNMRISARKVRHKYLRMCFDALFTWMNREMTPDGFINDPDKSGADLLKGKLRFELLTQTRRRQGIRIFLKAHNIGPLTPRDLHDKGKRVEAPKAAPDEVILNKYQEAAMKAAGLNTNTNAPFVPPNISELDKLDRDWIEEHTDQVMKFGKKIIKKIQGIENSAAKKSKERGDLENLKFRLMNSILEEEDLVTTNAIARELNHARNFKIHAAKKMVDVLFLVYLSVQEELLRQDMRKYFRAIRLPLYEKVSVAMRNRKKLENWIKLCRRLTSVQKLMPFYRERKVKWGLFNRWLKLVEHQRLYCSLGIVEDLKTRKMPYLKYHSYLCSENFQPSIYHENQRVYATQSTIPGLFARWQTYTQDEVLTRLLEAKAKRMHDLKFMRRTFYLLSRPTMTVSELSKAIEINPCFEYTRVICDVEQIIKRFLSYRRRCVEYRIQKYTHKYIRLFRKRAIKMDTFKNVMARIKTSIAQRLVCEQRMLVDAFATRGSLEFLDVRSPHDPRAHKMPLVMIKAEGRKFADPHLDFDGGNHNEANRGKKVPGGYKLSKIKIIFQEGLGICGWQLYWVGDKVGSLTSERRGKWLGAGSITHDFVIPPDDFMVGLDFTYEGAAIVAMRVHLHFAGVSPWAGRAKSMSALTVHLNVNMAERQSFEDDYEPVDDDEVRNPSLLRNYVVGLSGIDGPMRTTNIGLVVRKVNHQNLFSYMYIDDGLERERKRLEELRRRAKIFVNRRVRAAKDNDDDSSTFSNASGRESLPSVSPNANWKRASSKLDDKESSKDPYSDDPSGKPPEKVITANEVEFFDLLRMRSTEVKEAESKVTNFLNRIWRDKHAKGVNRDIVRPFANLRILSKFAEWLFRSLSKRLADVPKWESEASNMLIEARKCELQSEIFGRRAEGILEMVKNFDLVPQPWHNVAMLTPALRNEKFTYQKKIKEYSTTAAEYIKTSERLSTEQCELEHEGKRLLPRISLSTYIMRNYTTKMKAARHKGALLESMSMTQIRAVIGGYDADNGISEKDMQIIRDTLANGAPMMSGAAALVEIKEKAMKTMRAHRRGRQQSALFDKSARATVRNRKVSVDPPVQTLSRNRSESALAQRTLANLQSRATYSNIRAASNFDHSSPDTFSRQHLSGRNLSPHSVGTMNSPINSLLTWEDDELDGESGSL